MLDIVAVLLVLTAAFAWLNRKFLRWPPTIGVMAIALVVRMVAGSRMQLMSRLCGKCYLSREIVAW